MLGLGSSLLQGGALRSIVRSGLQLFYKADRTQAPLGEEQVRNNSFDEISSNLVSNPTFDLGSEEVVNGDFATDLSSWDISGTDATHTVTYSNGSARYQSDSVTPQLNFDQTISNVELGKTYQLSIDVTYTTGSLKVASIDANQTVLSEGLNVFNVVANSKTIRILRSANIVDALINSVSVKEVPNWELGDGWSVRDGKASNDGESGSNNLTQGSILTSNKSYQITIEVSDYVSGNVQVSAGGVPRGTMTANGTYTFNQVASGSSFYIVANSFVGSVDNVSVKQLDPNNRWTVLNPDTSAHTVEIREGETYINYDHDGGTQGSTGINQSGVFPNTTSKYKIEVELGEVTGQLKIQTRGVVNSINSSDSNTTKVILLDSSSDSQTHIFIVRLDDNISGSAFVKNVSVKEITNSIKDHSRNSNDGILYSGKALDFDGTGDIVELNDANLTGEFTVCTWIKPDTFTSCVVFGDGVDENDNYLNLNWIRLNSATSITVKIAGNSTGYAPITHGGNIAQDEWSRLIVTRGSDNIVRFGINGVLYSPSTTARAGTFDFNLLGRKESTEMNGALADVQVYDKAWTASDVEFDYNNPDKDVFDRVGEAQVLGEEEVDNGNFASNSGWGGINVAISDGKATINVPIDGSYSYVLRNMSSYINGRSYRLIATIKGLSGSSGKSIRFQDNDGNTGGLTNINGVVTLDESLQNVEIIWTANSNSNSIVVARNTNAQYSFEIHSISIKKITTHASHILPTDCKSLLRLNEGAGDRVYDAAPVLGEELNDLTWVDNGGWTINGDIASNDGSGSTFVNDILELGKTYQFKCKLSSYTSGDFRLMLGSSTISSNFSGTNEFTFIGVCTGDSFARVQSLVVAGQGAIGSLSISSLSIKEIKPAESFFITGDKNFLHQQPYIPQYAMSSFSKKMVFDGADDYVDCGSDASIDNIFTGGGTLSCWFSAESDGKENVGTIISKARFRLRTHSQAGGGVIIQFLQLFNTSNGKWDTDSIVLLNKLNHIAVTYDNSSLSNDPLIYVNGVIVDITKLTSPSGAVLSDESYNFTIGDVDPSGTHSYDGIIDEVSLFKSELTQDEVLELYNSGSSFDSTGHSKYNLGEEVSNGTFELGSEEVVDGDFPLPNVNWIALAGATIESNGARINNTVTGGVANVKQAILNPSGKTFEFTYDITATDGSTLVVQQLSNIDLDTATVGTNRKITFTWDLGIDDLIIKRKSGTTDVTIDNVSLKEISNWSSSTASSATMTVNTSGQLVLASDAGDNLGAYSSISLVQGRTYVLSVDIISCNVLGQIRIGTSASVGSTSPDDIFNAGGSGVPLGTNTYTFTASATQSSRNYLYIGGRDDVNSLVIDNVSLQEYGVSGYWRNNGADQWDDLSINSNHGTVSGSPTEIFLQEVPFFDKDSLGMFMNKPRLGGLNFAKNGWVEVRDNVSLDVASTNAISVCCWYRANSAASYDAAQYLVNSETYSNAGGWTLIAGTTQIVWTAEAGSNASIGYNHNDRLGWQYIVATYDEQNYRLFTFDENGDISVTTPVASTSALVDEYPINIGGFNEGSGSLINGVIDDIKIYNKALTQAEIKKNYNATKGKHKN